MSQYPKLELQTYIEESFSSDYGQRRIQLLELARLAESAERYQDMCKILKAIVELDTYVQDKEPSPRTLDPEERNLLSVAYKHVVSNLRTAWRTLNSDEAQGNPLVQEYRRQVEKELELVCVEILDLLEKHLINSLSSLNYRESQVFYLKLCGDYYRYLAEFKHRDHGCHDKARAYYQSAYELARSKIPGGDQEVLESTNPVRLGLALNFSVCYYEILEERNQACALAREAFESALIKLDELDEQQYKDSTMILMLLRDNLTLWDDPNERQTEEP